jgi:hypothetical protein
MKRAENHRRRLGMLLGVLLLVLCGRVSAKPGEIFMGAKEETFPVLETKTGAYTNVTVTKKTKDWVFILHSQGVCNIKAADLSTAARIALGYEEAPKIVDGKIVPATPAPSRYHFASFPHFKLANVKQFAADWRFNRKEKEAQVQAFIAKNPLVICTLLAIFAIVYVFSSICFWLICRKTHIAPGPLVWVPFLQLIPLLRAANMPRGWFFAYFIPVINIIAIIMLSIKIVKSRGKNPWVAFLLILPPTSLFAFLYLAFSRSAPVQMQSNEVLSLETA